MIHNELLELVESLLGKGKVTTRTNVAFFSPFRAHHKPKLEIDLSSDIKQHRWHCWVSGEKGRSLWSLFNAIGASSEAKSRLQSILNDDKSLASHNATRNQKYEEERLTLPSEFVPLSQWVLNGGDVIKNPFARNALWYLKKRSVTEIDIIRYNIGFCQNGVYGGRVIVPSYDSDHNLNYFISRTYMDSSMKYLNPSVPKDIIGFESLISWNFPIVLVEGVFDAIAMRFNAIPLLGKMLNKALLHAIIKHRVPHVYVCLDGDAKAHAIRMAETLSSCDVQTSIIDMDDADPSDEGFLAMKQRMNDAILTGYSQLVKAKLSI